MPMILRSRITFPNRIVMPRVFCHQDFGNESLKLDQRKAFPSRLTGLNHGLEIVEGTELMLKLSDLAR
jgi:hypothetical protein